MKNIKLLGLLGLMALLPLGSGCELNEDLNGTLSEDQVGGGGGGNAAALLDGAYVSLRDPFQGPTNVFALSEVTTDERIMPTRGGDWDDNGVWRQLHLHNWTADNTQIINAFNTLNGVVFATTDLLQFNPTPQQEAEARMLRAWAMYWVLDMFDQVPYRDPGEGVVTPSRVRRGLEALDYIIAEVQAVLPNLPDAPVHRATKDAARGLLMKCYLNRGVYANRQSPTFDAADMNRVIALADQITGSGRYRFAANYFDNFAPDNSNIGTENIFTQLNQGGVAGSGEMRNTWRFVSHYNMSPGGFNGPTATTDLYNRFEAQDRRRGQVYRYPNGPANPGNRVNVGLLVGQQYNLSTDVPLRDRPGAPLVFTPEVSIIETGSNLERTGIRPIKYVPDLVNDASGLTDNDHVHLRLPDILLMKAEAILRGGTATSGGGFGGTPVALVNAVRTHPSRGASALGAVTLPILLDERSRELYLESWRRQDMIRFGTFLQPFAAKSATSAPTYLIFPIPNPQLAVNPNLTQNPGY